MTIEAFKRNIIIKKIYKVRAISFINYKNTSKTLVPTPQVAGHTKYSTMGKLSRQTKADKQKFDHSFFPRNKFNNFIQAGKNPRSGLDLSPKV